MRRRSAHSLRAGFELVMKLRLKKALLIGVGVVVTALSLCLFVPPLVRQWSQVVETFQRANYLCLIPAIGFLGVLYYFRVVRWQLFLRPIKRVRKLSVTSATCIGFMANCVLPFRVGEIVRPYVLHRKEGIGFAHALATAAGLERIFDLIGLSLLLIITWFMMGTYVPRGSQGARLAAPTEMSGELGGTATEQGTGEDVTAGHIWKRGMLFAAMAAAGCVGLVALVFFPAPLLRLGESCTRVLPASLRGMANRFMHAVVDAMGFIKSWKGALVAAAYSLGIWVAQGLSNYALARGLGVDIGLAGAFFVGIAVAVAVAPPQLPAFAGSFHLAATVAAMGFHAAGGEAMAFALLMWLVNVLPITLVGLGFLWREGLGLGQLAAASRSLKEAPQPEG